MSDLIVALGGGDDRKNKAVSLLKSGQGLKILFTGDPNFVQEYTQWGVQGYGVIPSWISKDTIDDVRVIQATMLAYKFTSATIVDSAYHLPRTKLLFSRLFLYSATIDYVSVPTPTTFFQRLFEHFAYIKEFLTVWR
jgi:hypothetical protein